MMYSRCESTQGEKTHRWRKQRPYTFIKRASIVSQDFGDVSMIPLPNFSTYLKNRANLFQFIIHPLIEPGKLMGILANFQWSYSVVVCACHRCEDYTSYRLTHGRKSAPYNKLEKLIFTSRWIQLRSWTIFRIQRFVLFLQRDRPLPENCFLYCLPFFVFYLTRDSSGFKRWSASTSCAEPQLLLLCTCFSLGTGQILH